jgi:hypothetical protein
MKAMDRIQDALVLGKGSKEVKKVALDFYVCRRNVV